MVQLPPIRTPTRDQTHNVGCALDRNQTHCLLAYETTLQPTEPPGEEYSYRCFSFKTFLFLDVISTLLKLKQQEFALGTSRKSVTHRSMLGVLKISVCSVLPGEPGLLWRPSVK